MNIRFLETFSLLARLHSLRLTADKLHATPAAIASRITSLESAVGAPLFERQAGGFELTNAGRIFLSYAERIVLLEGHLHDLAQSRVSRRRLSVGVSDALLHAWLPLLKGLVAKIATDLPTPLELHIVSDTYAAMAQMLRSNVIDVMLHVERAAGAEYINTELCEMELAFMASPRLALGGRLVTLQSIQHVSWIGAAPFTTLHDTLEHALALGLARLPAIHSVHSLMGVSRMIEDGFGVGILPEPFVAQALAEKRLDRLDVNIALPPLKATATYSAASDATIHRLVGRLRSALLDYQSTAVDSLAVAVKV